MRRPSSNSITMHFGATTDPYSPGDPHIGTDYAPDPDGRVYAPEAGRVTLTHGDPRMGNAVHIWIANRHHALCHMDQIYVTEGQQVVEGQVLGTMGWTGYVVPAGPPGKHLHHAVTVDNVLVDSLTLIDKEPPMDGMSLQQQLDLMTYKFNASESALRAREELTSQQVKAIDLLQYQLDESEKALRAREEQAAAYEKRIAELLGGAGFELLAEPVYIKKQGA